MTNCSVKYPRRIYIIPVFSGTIYTKNMAPVSMNADTVYLITRRPNSVPKNADRVFSQFDETKKIELKIVRGFEDDMYYAIGTLRKIIESERGNYIYIDLSIGSPMWTSAGLMATMLFSDDDEKTEITPYYLTQNNRAFIYLYTNYEKSNFGINTLPVDFRIEKPQDEILRALKSIADLENMGIGVTKTVLIESLIHLGFDIPAENPPTPGIHNAVQRKYLNPLLEGGYITASGCKKRSEYSVTEKGKNALHAFVE